jgi:hypothetical protein
MESSSSQLEQLFYSQMNISYILEVLGKLAYGMGPHIQKLVSDCTPEEYLPIMRRVFDKRTAYATDAEYLTGKHSTLSQVCAQSILRVLLEKRGNNIMEEKENEKENKEEAEAAEEYSQRPKFSQQMKMQMRGSDDARMEFSRILLEIRELKEMVSELLHYKK